MTASQFNSLADIFEKCGEEEIQKTLKEIPAYLKAFEDDPIGALNA
jgi:hypothetical protein